MKQAYRKPTLTVTALLIALIAIDQAIKLTVKTNMTLGESVHITDWFQIVFIENNGMAYGMSFINKYALSIFRLIAVCAIGYYISRLITRGWRMSYIVCLTVVMAGAAGNIVDCLFYGEIFSQSTYFDVAQRVPWGEGYSTFLQGKVVDMFYFPLIRTTWPEWMPLCGGEEYVFFSPVFNFADACISCGVVALILFFRRDFETTLGRKDSAEKAEADKDQ